MHCYVLPCPGQHHYFLVFSDIMNKMEKGNKHLEFAQVIQMGDDTKVFLIEPLL